MVEMSQYVDSFIASEKNRTFAPTVGKQDFHIIKRRIVEKYEFDMYL